MTVFTEPGAMIRLEPQNPNQNKIKLSKTADKNGTTFENLIPAKYKIVAQKDGFVTQQENDFVIQPRKKRA